MVRAVKNLDIENTVAEIKKITKIISPRLLHLQETVQNIEKIAGEIHADQTSYAEKARVNIDNNDGKAFIKTAQNTWSLEASFVVTKIKDFSTAKDSSAIKTTLNCNFTQRKFIHVMKTSDGRIIVETDSKATAEEITTNWNTDMFGGSQCRLTRKPTNLVLIAKGLPLPNDISANGIEEENLQAELNSKFDDCVVQRIHNFKKQPLNLLKIIMQNEEQVNKALTEGVCIGNLWLQVELEQRPPRDIQCYKCLKFGHISAACRAKTSRCSICSLDGHNHKSCAENAISKCKNCGGSHVAV